MDMSSSSSSSSSAPMTSMNSTSNMQIVFFTSTTTPLYSTSWTPSTTSQYAGTCIFLIFLAVIFRALFGLRTIQERKWQRLESGRRYVIAGVAEEEKEKEEGQVGVKEGKMSVESGSERSGSSDGGDGDAVVFQKRRRSSAVRPWRLSEDLPRACLGVVIAGVGYLLMLAVMTTNVGYFMSVLGGTFLGDLIAGRFSNTIDH